MLKHLAFYSGFFPIIPSWVSEEFLLKNQHRYLCLVKCKALPATLSFTLHRTMYAWLSGESNNYKIRRLLSPMLSMKVIQYIAGDRRKQFVLFFISCPRLGLCAENKSVYGWKSPLTFKLATLKWVWSFKTCFVVMFNEGKAGIALTGRSNSRVLILA